MLVLEGLVGLHPLLYQVELDMGSEYMSMDMEEAELSFRYKDIIT